VSEWLLGKVVDNIYNCDVCPVWFAEMMFEFFFQTKNSICLQIKNPLM